ncbi:hypothetical protein LUW77_04850 [Streptomyces radiopugnans]|nr:hypothetical protein LUW77_04850 [Streptomyces radiopugnans]
MEPSLRGDRVEPALRALLDHSLAALHRFPGEHRETVVRCVQVHGVLLDSVHADIPAHDRTAYLHAASLLLEATLPDGHTHAVAADHIRLIAPHATALLHRVDRSTASGAVRLAVRVAQRIYEARRLLRGRRPGLPGR